MKRIFNTFSLVAILITPFFAFAAVKNFKDLVNFLISTFVTPAIILIFAAAIVFFMWNIFGLIRKSDQPEELADFKSRATWGIIAIAVMVSMWGLVNFITGSLNLDTTTGIKVRTGP